MANNRLASIDILRALTMLFMIFVNDLWSLTDIPNWLGHADGSEDRMGFADVIFPAFMFIIGLSIPHAIKARINKGDNQIQVITHILARSFALIVMGVFMVNLENIDQSSSMINKHYWQLLMFFAFVMIWNNYRNPKVLGVIPPIVVKSIGWAILILLAYIYKGTGDNWMLIHWWGILGLLGWSYLVCAICYLFIGDRVIVIAAVGLMLLMLNVNEFLWGVNIKLIISASNYLSVLLGVLATVIHSRSTRNEGDWQSAVAWLMGIAIMLLIFGLVTRPEWGISKIRATPSWTAICGAISMLSFIVLLVISDVKGFTNWAKPIAAGGYATLTCYLLPYFMYSMLQIVGVDLPDMMTTGIIGLIKSLLFGWLIIQMAAWIGKVDIRLKI
ncbi:MAG: DUF5009 domain-containing protein [Cyclobacteriaceae bacterium]